MYVFTLVEKKCNRVFTIILPEEPSKEQCRYTAQLEMRKNMQGLPEEPSQDDLAYGKKLKHKKRSKPKLGPFLIAIRATLILC